MFVRQLFEKLDRMIAGLVKIVEGQKKIERILKIMSQTEVEIEAKLQTLFGQNDTLVSLLGTFKTELDAAAAAGADAASLQGLSAKIDAEIAKNAAALAQFQPAPTAPPVVAPPVAADPSAGASAPPVAATADAGSPPPAADPAAS